MSDVRKDVEPKTAVLVLTRAVPELQPIPPDAVAPEVRARRSGSAARRCATRRRSARSCPTRRCPRASSCSRGCSSSRPRSQKGQQEISILINADTGVAGKLRPGDIVDVLATFQPDDKTRSPASARTIIRRARDRHHRAAARGRAARAAPDRRAAPGRADAQQVLVPVTFALRPTLACA